MPNKSVTFNLVTTAFLHSSAQVYLLPINSHALVTNKTLDACNQLYPKNYNAYAKASNNGTLRTATALLVKQENFSIGLTAPNTGIRPDYIANLVYNSHPRQIPRLSWLIGALEHIVPELSELIKDKGIKKIALYAKPLQEIYDVIDRDAVVSFEDTLQFWHEHTLPAIQEVLAQLPPVAVDIHVPSS